MRKQKMHKVTPEYNLQVINPDLAKQWHPTKNGDLTPKKITPGSAKRVWWVCEQGHEWKAPVGARSKGTRCPYCSIIRKSVMRFEKKLDKKDKRAFCYVTPDQRPLAIGKNGQNVRLASELSEWEIDILDISEYEVKKSKKEEPKVQKVDELGLEEEIINKLKEANLEMVEQLKGLKVKDLTAIEGISEEEAEEIIKAVKE